VSVGSAARRLWKAYPRSQPTAEKVAAGQALAQLSDAEWMQVKSDEERRRADQCIIRDLSSRYRELRDRKAAR